MATIVRSTGSCEKIALASSRKTLPCSSPNCPSSLRARGSLGCLLTGRRERMGGGDDGSHLGSRYNSNKMTSSTKTSSTSKGLTEGISLAAPGQRLVGPSLGRTNPFRKQREIARHMKEPLSMHARRLLGTNQSPEMQLRNFREYC
jgi:hypothetical protein